MKGRLFVFVSIFCIAALIVSGQEAQAKPDEPPGKSKIEWIEFWGDLVGGEPVDGCCPNAGPDPSYRMCLNFEVGDNPAGTWYDGYLFINFYGAGKDRQYKVVFWNYEIGIKIIGGVIDFDRKNKTLTVTFTDELCVDLWTGQPIAEVSFTLVRRPY